VCLSSGASSQLSMAKNAWLATADFPKLRVSKMLA